MARVQRIIDLVQKSILDFPGGQKEKNSFETDKHVSLSPDEPVPLHSSFTIADKPFQDNPTPVNKAILIVEDEPILANELQDILISNGFVTGIAVTIEGAIGHVNETRPDLILMDINLGSESTGIEAAERILSQISIPIIYITTCIDSATVTRANITNPCGFILKPLDSREILTAIEIAFHEHEKNEQLKKGYDELEQRVAERTADLKRIIMELRKNNEYYRSLFDRVPVGIYRSSPAGQILDVNTELVHKLGYPDRKSLLAVKVHDLFLNLEDCKQWQAILKRDGVVRNFEVQFRKYGGSTIWVRDTGEVTLDESGRSVYYNGIVEDISERKHAEVGFAESENRYRAVVEDQTELICRFAPDGTLTFVNDAYCRYFGLDRNDCIGKQHTVVLLPEDNRMMKTHIASLSPAHPFASIRHRIIMPSGKARWQHWSDRAIFDKSGAVKEYQSVGRDITDIIQAEEELRESENHYRQLVEMSPDAILILNDSRIMELNSSALTLFGASSPGQLVGKSFMSLVHPNSQKACKKWIRWEMNAKIPHSPIEQKIVQLDGTILEIEAAAVLVTYHGRSAVQVIARDITQRKMLENQVKIKKEILEKLVQDRTFDLLRSNEKLKMEVVERKAIQEELTIASNEKDLLLREIHHRVKNNLQLIIGLIDMTKMRTHEPGMTAVLTDIMTKIHTMGFVHTRLYESERFDKINMKQHVTELVDMTSGFYSHEHCKIDFVIDCDDINLPVDQAMPCALALNELLSNIHKHAFKGRRTGIVEISSSMENAKIRLVIHDNGVGLPNGFDIEQSNRLGLKLMRALVEQQLHGLVTIKSQNGTRVVIEIPLKRSGTDHGKSTLS
jgi:PAS domain S-box-containing protein